MALGRAGAQDELAAAGGLNLASPRERNRDARRGAARPSALELQARKARVESSGGGELLVRSLLDDATLVEDDERIHASDCG